MPFNILSIDETGRTRLEIGHIMRKFNESPMEEDIIIFNFIDMYGKELKAASRGGYPFTLMLVSVVDKSSGVCGMETQELAYTLGRVLKTKTRDTDSSFAYGPGRVIILLPFADKKGGMFVEKKIRDIFKSHSLLKNKTQEAELVIDHVTFPDDGKIKDNLLEKLEMMHRNR